VSEITSEYMSGNGWGYASELEESRHSSIFEVYFSVTSSQLLTVTGSLFASGSGWNGDGVYFGFVGPDEFDSFYGVVQGDASSLEGDLDWDVYAVGSYQLVENFFLTPGDYRFYFKTSDWQSSASWSFNAAFIPAVPIPAAAWLMGSSMIGLLGLKRRRK
jgi:hypothetical protein